MTDFTILLLKFSVLFILGAILGLYSERSGREKNDGPMYRRPKILRVVSWVVCPICFVFTVGCVVLWNQAMPVSIIVGSVGIAFGAALVFVDTVVYRVEIQEDAFISIRSGFSKQVVNCIELSGCRLASKDKIELYLESGAVVVIRGPLHAFDELHNRIGRFVQSNNPVVVIKRFRNTGM